MVDNNKIPIEVKKPVETVYELKNEIPSFEEFMKTYEGSVNYADLSGGGIGEAKGYGPCRRHCGYNNSGCTYYLPDFAPLYMACPACDSYNSGDASLWLHSSCGGPMYISERLRLECKDCYEGGHWKEWEFACSKHKGYKSATSYLTFKTAIRAGLGIQAGNSALADLVDRVSIELIKEGRKYR